MDSIWNSCKPLFCLIITCHEDRHEHENFSGLVGHEHDWNMAEIALQAGLNKSTSARTEWARVHGRSTTRLLHNVKMTEGWRVQQSECRPVYCHHNFSFTEHEATGIWKTKSRLWPICWWTLNRKSQSVSNNPNTITYITNTP